jgi:hypothetical protein
VSAFLLAIYASLSQDVIVPIQWVKKTQPEIHDITTPKLLDTYGVH